MSLTPYEGWSLDFTNVQRSNQFHQLSESGQHEYSRRGMCGIWSRDLTGDHLPKAVVQRIRREEGNVAITLRRVEVLFEKCAEI